jgi:hypothetical protein
MLDSDDYKFSAWCSSNILHEKSTLYLKSKEQDVSKLLVRKLRKEFPTT